MVNFKYNIGSRAQVMHGNAKQTGGGLTKKQLKYNKRGKIVSRKASKSARKSNNLVKAGYITRKGVFGIVNSYKGGSNIIESGFANSLKASVNNLEETINNNSLLNSRILSNKEIKNRNRKRIYNVRERMFRNNLSQINSLKGAPWILYVDGNGRKNTTKSLMNTWDKKFKEKFLCEIHSNSKFNESKYKRNTKKEFIPNSLQLVKMPELYNVKYNSNRFLEELGKGTFNIYLENLHLILTALKMGSKNQLKRLRELPINNINQIIENLYKSHKLLYEHKINGINERIINCIYIWTSSAYSVIANIYRQLYFNTNNTKTNTLIKNINLLTIESIFNKYSELKLYNFETSWDEEPIRINNNLFNYQYNINGNKYSNIEVIIYITCLFDFIKLGKIERSNINRKLNLIGIKQSLSRYNYNFISGIYPKNKVMIYRGCGINTYFRYRKTFNIREYNKLLNELLLIQSIESYTGNIDIALRFAAYSKKNVNLNNLSNINMRKHMGLNQIETGILELNIVNPSVPLLYISSISKIKDEEEFLIPVFTPKSIIGKAKFPLNLKIITNNTELVLNDYSYNSISKGLALFTEIGNKKVR